MRTLIAIAATLALAACSKEEVFIQTHCGIMDNGVLWIKVKSESASRVVTLNSKADAITYRGTTLKDMKWASNISQFDFIGVDPNNMFQLKPKGSEAYQVGIIDHECQLKLQQQVGELFNELGSLINKQHS